jgi:hypothetical protein
MMKVFDSTRSLIYAMAYLALWVVTLLLLKVLCAFNAEDALTAFVILGLIFPALALLVTRKTTPLEYRVRRPTQETVFLITYLAIIAIVLVAGLPGVNHIAAEPLHSLAVLAEKLAMFVLIPTAILMLIGR